MAQAFKSAKILWICHRSKLSLFTVFAIVTGTVFIIFSFWCTWFCCYRRGWQFKCTQRV